MKLPLMAPGLVLGLVLGIGLQWLCDSAWADANLSQGNAGESILNEITVNKRVVLNLLKGYEWQLRTEQFNRLGPGADKFLLEIAADKSEANFIRARAARALMLFPGEEISMFYRKEITTEGSSALRRQLVQNYCDAYWRSEPNELSDLIVPLLSEEDVLLRTRAAKCLSRIDSVNSRKALREYRNLIADSWEMKAAGFKEQELK